MTDVAINAVDHGFTPTAPNPTTALNTAIQAAITAGKPLFIPPGTYTVGGAVINGPLEIYGVPGKVTFRLGSGANNILYVSAATRARISGINFDGQNLSFGTGWDYPALVYIKRDQAANTLCVVEHCKIYNTQEAGVTYYGTGGVLRHCEIYDCNGESPAVFAVDADDLSIRANHIHDCDNNAILVWRETRGRDGTIVDGNVIAHIGAALGGSSQYGNAVNIFRADGVVVSNNVIEDCEFTAVRSNVASDVVMTGNNCKNIREVALYFEHTGGVEPAGAYAAVISNNIIESCAQGVSVTNFNNSSRVASVSGNVIRRCTIRQNSPDPRGIGISVEADSLVSGNVVEDADVYGIVLGTGDYTRNVVAIGNVVVNFDATLTTNAGIGVSGTTGAGYQSVVGNMVHMKSSPGAAYGLVALDAGFNIIMSGSTPKVVNSTNFPKVTTGSNSIHT